MTTSTPRTASRPSRAWILGRGAARHQVGAHPVDTGPPRRLGQGGPDIPAPLAHRGHEEQEGPVIDAKDRDGTGPTVEIDPRQIRGRGGRGIAIGWDGHQGPEHGPRSAHRAGACEDAVVPSGGVCDSTTAPVTSSTPRPCPHHRQVTTSTDSDKTVSSSTCSSPPTE